MGGVGLYIFCYILVAYGASNIIVFSSGPFRIFEYIRSLANSINEHFGSLFDCMMCLPANFGWICSLVNILFVPIAFTPFNLLLGELTKSIMGCVLICLCDGAFTSGVVWILHNIETYFENKGKDIKNVEYTDAEQDDIIEVTDITKRN